MASTMPVPAAEQAIRNQLTELEIFYLTVWAEARGEGERGIALVGCAIRNRVTRPGWWGTSYRTVCLKPGQYSCWDPGTDPNHLHLMRVAARILAGPPPVEPRLDDCQAIAAGIYHDVTPDLVNRADHYYNPDGMVPKGSAPRWAFTKTGAARVPALVYGRQRYYAIGLNG